MNLSLISCDDLPSATSGFLFETREFQGIHRQTSSLYLKLSSGNALGYMSAKVDFQEMNVVSPPVGPFGGIHWIKGGGFSDSLDAYILIMRFAAENSFKKITVRLPPDLYSSLANYQLLALKHLGAEIISVDLSYILPVGERADAQSAFSRGAQRALKKLKELGFTAQASSAKELPELLEIIRRNRLQNGFIPPMPESVLSRQVSAITANYFFYSVFSPIGERVAAAICVKTFKHVVYVQYWGDLLDSRRNGQSPVVLLADTIISEMPRIGARFIDLGTSSINNSVLTGVAAFKRSLGATTALIHSIHLPTHVRSAQV